MRYWEEIGEILPRRKSRAGTRYYAYRDIIALGGLPLVEDTKTQESA
jgi:DNA-binding transcriptional MerR regulator